MRLDHVTAIVPDAEAAAEALSSILGSPPVAVVRLPGMEIRSFRVGDAELHLNAPTGDGPVAEHLAHHGAGLHHLALHVDDLDAVIVTLGTQGIRVKGAPVETAPGLREVFLDPGSTGGLWIQLVERAPAAPRAVELGEDPVAALVGQLAPNRFASS